VAVVVSVSQIDLSWTDNSTDETGFGIFRGTSEGTVTDLIATVGDGVVVYSDTGLPSSTTFYYLVKSFNIFGYSGASNIAGSTTATPEEWSDPWSFTTGGG
jgi:hypothetical protein